MLASTSDYVMKPMPQKYGGEFGDGWTFRQS